MAYRCPPKKFTVIFIEPGRDGKRRTVSHRIKAQNDYEAFHAYDACTPKRDVIAAIKGWPEVSGIDHTE